MVDRFRSLHGGDEERRIGVEEEVVGNGDGEWQRDRSPRPEREGGSRQNIDKQLCMAPCRHVRRRSRAARLTNDPPSGPSLLYVRETQTNMRSTTHPPIAVIARQRTGMAQRVTNSSSCLQRLNASEVQRMRNCFRSSSLGQQILLQKSITRFI